MKDNKEELKTEFLDTLDSIEWWKGRANQMIGKIQLLENKFNADTATAEDRKLYKFLLKETKSLIARGEVENKYLGEIELKLMEEHDDPKLNDPRET